MAIYLVIETKACAKQLGSVYYNIFSICFYTDMRRVKTP